MTATSCVGASVCIYDAMRYAIHRAGLALAIFSVGCGGPQDPADEHLTAEEHEREAAQEEAEADEHVAEYDPDARQPTAGGMANPDFHGLDVYNPTAGEIVEAEEHREHAAAHREQAQALRDFEEAECANFPPASRASCPLLLGLEEVVEIDGGMRLRFGEGVDHSSVVDHVRCHIAFAAARGLAGISHCALYVPGVRVEVDGPQVSLTTDEDDQVADLRRRVRLQAPPDGE